MQEPDFLCHDNSEDDVAPSVYGDIYGKIRTEKDSQSTSARVTDYGRINTILSNAACPILQRQGGFSSTLRLNVVIQVVDSRGDVQPFRGLGKRLERHLQPPRTFGEPS